MTVGRHKARHRIAALACRSVLALALASGAAVAQDAACFDGDAKPDAFVLQQAPPPLPGARRYAFYPATGFATMNIDAIERTQTGASVYYWQWANHGLRKRHKANILPRLRGGPLQKAANFSSRSLADQCTLAQTAAVLGEAPQLPTGLKAVPLAEMPTGEQTDVCAIPPRIAGRYDGIVLDYEVFDGRTPEETRDFLLRYAALVKRHGKTVILYTNPLDAPSQARTGIAAHTLPEISAAYDYVTIVLWGRNRQGSVPASFRAQAEMLGPATRTKGLITFELAGTTAEDARFVRGLLQEGQVAGVNLWRNYARQGGACDTDTNRKISCVAFGRC